MKRRNFVVALIACILSMCVISVTVFANAPDIIPVDNLKGERTYQVYINPMVNGTVTCNGSTFVAGGVVILTVNPDSGYELADIEAHYGMAGQITLTKITGGYKFTMPKADVIVNATFKVSSNLPKLNVEKYYDRTLWLEPVDGTKFYCVEVAGYKDYYDGDTEDINLYELCDSKSLSKGTYSIKIYACDAYKNPISQTYTCEFFYVKIGTVNCVVRYRTQVETYGWQEWVSDGELSGTVGKAKRLEGINIFVENDGYLKGGVKYRTHVEKQGWQEWVSNGQLSGTVGKSLRLEAIAVYLTGEIAQYFDIFYRVQTEKIGWMGWCRGGDKAGTEGFGLRLEAIEMAISPKNMYGSSEAPDGSGGYNPENPCYFNKKDYGGWQYRTHVQTYGWQNWVNDGAVSGTVGKGKRLEGIQIGRPSNNSESTIAYRTHVQSYGWQNWVNDGAVSGTVGKGKRLEAIQIKFASSLEDIYDIYYRVHSEKFGWLGWAKTGEMAGTAGYGYRLEAIQIRLIHKKLPSILFGITTGKKAYYQK